MLCVQDQRKSSLQTAACYKAVYNSYPYASQIFSQPDFIKNSFHCDNLLHGITLVHENTFAGLIIVVMTDNSIRLIKLFYI